MSKKQRNQPATPTHWGGDSKEPVLDHTPVAMPVNHMRPTPLHELIAKFVRDEQARSEEELETYEDANDFEPDEPEDVLQFTTPYTVFETVESEDSVDSAEPAAQPDTQPEPDQAKDGDSDQESEPA